MMKYLKKFELMDARLPEEAMTIYRNRTMIDATSVIDDFPTLANLVILFIGSVLNIVTLFVIAFNPFLYTAPTCYILSLVISNFLVLFATLWDVLSIWFDELFVLHVDYVSYVTFEASILTIAIFSLDRYVVFYQTSISGKIASSSTAIKSVLIVWSMAIMMTAMELNLYVHFERETATHIFLFSTLMFIVCPGIVIGFLGGLLLLKLKKSLQTSRPKENVESFLLLVGLTFGFVVTMVPHRIATVMYYVDSTLCCSERNKYLCYLAVKMSSIFTPIVYLATSSEFRRALKNSNNLMSRHPIDPWTFLKN